MKYEKLADALVSLIHGSNYKYRMYKGDDGKRTSNPYEARYFYITEPNMMFIIDESDNTLTIHKSNIPFDEFRTLHKTIRNLCKRYFINLEIKDYNSNFTPKDFSPTLLRKKYKVDNIKNESYDRSSIRHEVYTRNENVVDITENSDTIVVSHNGNELVTLPYNNNELIPLIVERTLVDNALDVQFIRKLYEYYDKYSKLKDTSGKRPLTLSEQHVIDGFEKFFG